MDCATLRYSRHALERMFQRAITPDAVRAVLVGGEVVISYPDDLPYPSALMLGFYQGDPLHVVVARDAANGDCQVVTVYRPDPALWADDFRTRRQP